VLLAEPALAKGDIAEEIADGLTLTIPWVSFGAPVAMTVLGGSSTHRVGRRAADSVLGAAAVAEGLKRVHCEGRPSCPTDSRGFPSGHTAIAFALATGIGDQYRQWRTPLYAWATAVGWSRYKLDQHFAHQVIAGALIGFTVARVSRDSHEGVCGGLFIDEDSPSGFVGPKPGEIGLMGNDATLWQWRMEF
jgi:membrane-associated phospholipid phosphatase